MKKINLIVSFLFAFLIVIQLSAKDQTHEKPDEFPEPDNHRIFFRNTIGWGNYTIPEVGEDATSANALTAMSFIGGYPTIYSYSSKKNAAGSNSERGLEYRYKDKFRIMYDVKNTSVTVPSKSFISGDGISLAQSGSYDWREDVTKTGFAYYHPVTNRFNVGGILRNYKIEQGYGLGIYGNGSVIDYNINITSFSAIGSYAKMTGLVPGVGLEFKIFRWLDFLYTVEGINLKGTKTTLDFSMMGLSSGFTGLLLYSISAANSSFTYKGNIQNATFVIRYSSWFSTKIGYSMEKFTRQYNSYYESSGFDSPASILIGSILYSSLVQSTANFNYLSVQFEFSKGF